MSCLRTPALRRYTLMLQIQDCLFDSQNPSPDENEANGLETLISLSERTRLKSNIATVP